jgi:sodium/bile acid cotransporter 7
MWSRLVARTSRVCPDAFVLSLLGVVLVATLAPCRGTSAAVCHGLGIVAIASLFFLQGARLSPAAILDGIICWRLHATVATATFVLFPLTGLALSAVFATTLPPLLWTGVLFLSVLPSTVQSSIALTSMANGNVAGAICSATASNVTGIALTPLIFSVLSRVHGGGISLGGVGKVFCELLVPFVAGHSIRPRIGGWVERNRRVLSFTDRGSILLVVYGAFSAGVVQGIWQRLPPTVLLPLTFIVVLLLTIALLGINVASVALGISKQDTIAATFCGSQKSLVSGVPMASALFSAAAIGPVLIPIMIYYPMQLVVCAWLARRYASAPDDDVAVHPHSEDIVDVGYGLPESTSHIPGDSRPCWWQGKGTPDKNSVDKGSRV